jgi:uncharacterized protein (TIGR00299 family) protein
MRIAYFDCFSGASGDMILGAMIDAGLSLKTLREELENLRVSGLRLKTRKVLKAGIAGTQVIVERENERRPHRNLKEMLLIIDRSRLDSEIKEKSKTIFQRIASVEATIHHIPIEEVHFHELGGLDSVVDIVGSVLGLRHLKVDEVWVSRVNVGGGFVKCAHGMLPVPAPATLSLMKGKPIYSSGIERELLTPTGAAILTTLGSKFGEMPLMKVEKIGYGAGRDELPHPNLLRLMIGSSLKQSGKERVTVIETNIDDMNPQLFDYIMERLFKMGAFDVFLIPVMMKKNRPGLLLTVISPMDKRQILTEFLLRETTTLGMRWREEERVRAEREILILNTPYGKVRFKIAYWEGERVNLSPEYEDCKRIAIKQGIPLKDIFDEAKRTAMKWFEGKK